MGQAAVYLGLSLSRGRHCPFPMASQVSAKLPEQMVLRQESEGQEKAEGMSLEAKLVPGGAGPRWSHTLGTVKP